MSAQEAGDEGHTAAAELRGSATVAAARPVGGPGGASPGIEQAFRVICQRPDGAWMIEDVVARDAPRAFASIREDHPAGELIPCAVYPSDLSPMKEGRIVQQWRARLSMHTCLLCGYDLAGLPDVELLLCPECGVGMRGMGIAAVPKRTPPAEMLSGRWITPEQGDATKNAALSGVVFDPGRLAAGFAAFASAIGLLLPEAAAAGLVIGVMAFERTQGRRGWVGIALGCIGLVVQMLLRMAA